MQLAPQTGFGSANVRLTGFLDQLGVRPTSVRLHLHPPGRRWAAWCEPGAIHVRPPADDDGFWRDGGLGSLVLAHEAAHVGQFARSGRPASAARLEREADTVAAVLMMGGEASVRLAAAPGRLHWSRVGHYYTTYLIALVAGASEPDALRWAFLSQLPDLVSELDATTQGKIQESLIGSDVPATLAGKMVRSDPSVKPQDYEVCRDVMEGLHCLTGAPVSDEQERRIGNTLKAQSDLEFGVSLHPLGDAWAHASDWTMYGHTYGHGFMNHMPDLLWVHQVPYFNYIQALFQIMSAKVAKVCYPGMKPRLSLGEVTRRLHHMIRVHPDGDDEPRQIPDMRAMILEMLQNEGLASYQPEYECVSWNAFMATGYGGIACLGPGDLSTILKFAQAWRVTPRDTRDPAVRIAEAQSLREQHQKQNATFFERLGQAQPQF